MNSGGISREGYRVGGELCAGRGARPLRERRGRVEDLRRWNAVSWAAQWEEPLDVVVDQLQFQVTPAANLLDGPSGVLSLAQADPTGFSSSRHALDPG